MVAFTARVIYCMSEIKLLCHNNRLFPQTYPLLGETITSSKWTSSAFHKVKRWYYSGVVGRFICQIYSGFHPPKIIQIDSFWLEFLKNNRVTLLDQTVVILGYVPCCSPGGDTYRWTTTWQLRYRTGILVALLGWMTDSLYDTIYLRALKSWRCDQLSLVHGTETKKIEKSKTKTE